MKILRKILQKLFSKPKEEKLNAEEIICYQHGRWIRILYNGKLAWEGPIDFIPEDVKQIYKEHNKHVSWVHGEEP